MDSTIINNTNIVVGHGSGTKLKITGNYFKNVVRLCHNIATLNIISDDNELDLCKFELLDN